mgnify:CR=1 FL=1
MRSMNWKEPVIENVVINGKFFPRIGKLRIAGIPYKGASLKALAEVLWREDRVQLLLGNENYLWAVGAGRRRSCLYGSF